jgi:hypothetical protein
MTTTNEPINQNHEKLLLTLPFHPGLRNIHDAWNRNLNILRQHPDTSFLAQMKVTIAYRRPQNIKDILVKTDVKQDKLTPGSHPCRQRRCQTCPFMNSTNEYTSTTSNITYRIKGHYDCHSISVIYLITCQKCGIRYVGQTGSTMNKRFTGHRFDIRHELEKLIPKHFSESAPHSLRDLRITIIDTGKQNVTTRILRETAYIRQLKTMEPHGLNIGQANI